MDGEGEDKGWMGMDNIRNGEGEREEGIKKGREHCLVLD